MSWPPDPDAFDTSEAFARELDAQDPLAAYRDRFHYPRRPTGPDGRPPIYFCGNSLGLQPKGADEMVDAELEAWAELGVEGHFGEETEGGHAPWYPYHELFRESAARLVGARPIEVVLMNSLTVNLHLMMVSFYRPTRARHKILIEDPTFPSDLYAVKSQLRWHGYDPDEGLVRVRASEGVDVVTTEEIEALLAREGEQIALVLMSGVNYFTGQRYDLETITRAAHAQGCTVGFDLAHAAGNVPLALHDWGVDFAAWCSYKYLNGGPGAVAGCFVHERHGRDAQRPRFAGWWGNDPARRFEMHLWPQFEPRAGADGWQLSNPPILALAPLRAALARFDEAGMSGLREKSVALTGYLEFLLRERGGDAFALITPTDPAARGCQLSLRARRDPEACFAALGRAGVVGDLRRPDVIRVAPVPLYNTFHEVWRFAAALADVG